MHTLTFGDLAIGDVFHMSVISGLLVDVDNPRPDTSRALVKLSARRYCDDGTGDVFRVGSVKVRVWREAPAAPRPVDIFTPTPEQVQDGALTRWLSVNSPTASAIGVRAMTRR